MQFVRKSMHTQDLEKALGKAWDERMSVFLKCRSSINSDEDWKQFEIADLKWEQVLHHYRLTGENPKVV